MGNLQRKSTSHTSQVLEDMLYDQKYHKIDRERKKNNRTILPAVFYLQWYLQLIRCKQLSSITVFRIRELWIWLHPDSSNLSNMSPLPAHMPKTNYLLDSFLAFLLRWLYPSERRLSAFNTVTRKAFVNSDYACHFLNAPPVLSHQKDRIIG